MPSVYTDTKPNVDIIGGMLDDIQFLTRKMADPSVTFVDGEWVVENANGHVTKASSGSAAIVPEPIRPRMIFGGTDRHDVAESDSLTCLRGGYKAKTLKYKASSSFANGNKLVIYWDGTYGILGKIGSGDTFMVVGEVTKAPATDVTDYLEFEAYATPYLVVVA